MGVRGGRYAFAMCPPFPHLQNECLKVPLDLVRVRHPAQLDHDLIKSLVPSHVQQLLDAIRQLVAQRAAGATVLQLDCGNTGRCFVGRDYLSAVVLDEIGVDINACDVVDYHPHLETLIVLQDMLEGSGFT